MSDTAPPPGLELLRQRLAAIPGGLESLGRDWPGRSPKAGTPSRVVVTGLGSSEAHARYLVRLLNRRTRIPAEFLPTGAFVDCGFGGWADRTLVVFSQGLSANARIALARRDAFRGLVLFTAATPEGLVAAGKAERAEFLRGLVSGGAETVRFPPEDEFTILIRVLGPVLGFLAARLWADALDGEARAETATAVGRDAAAAYLRGFGAGAGFASALADTGLDSGCVLLVSPSLVEHAQNLACKFVEGFFRPAPAVMDLLAFAHGPFQQVVARPRPVIVLHRDTPVEHDLARRVRAMCDAGRLEYLGPPALVSDEDLLPFEAEGLLNRCLEPLILRHGVDQIDWPGKGADGPLYLYAGPSSPAA